MRPFTSLFRINGKPMLAPDADVEVSYSDLDGEDSGRDESGTMRRIVARYKVATWPFVYSSITEEEKQYMERLFPDEPDFEFTCPDRIDANKEVTVRAYRSNYSTTWHNARTGLWRNYKFNIIEC